LTQAKQTFRNGKQDEKWSSIVQTIVNSSEFEINSPRHFESKPALSFQSETCACGATNNCKVDK